MKSGGGCENLGRKTRRYDNVVILWRLVSCNQDRVGLPKMNIKGFISVLEGMSSFNLNQKHFVALYSEINSSYKPHIRYPKPVSLACKTIYATVSMRYHIGWRGKRNILIRVWKPLPSKRVLKTLRRSPKGKAKEDNMKTVSASCRLGLLQMVSEPGTGRCASEEAEPKEGGHEVVCPQGRLALKGGGLGGFTSIGEENECQQGR